MFFLRTVVLLMGFLVTPMCFAGVIAENTIRDYGKAVADENWHEAVTYFSASDVKKVRKAFEPMMARGSAQPTFYPGKTPEEIDKLSDTNFFAGIFEGIFKLSGSRGITVTIQMPEVLGSVTEGSNTIHFAYRQAGSLNDSDISIVDIKTANKVGNSWFVKLPEEIDNVIASQETRD